VITVEGLGSCRLGLHPIQVIVYDVLYYISALAIMFLVILNLYLSINTLNLLV